MTVNSWTPRFLIYLLSGCVCFGGYGFMTSVSLAETKIEEVLANPEGNTSPTNVAPDTSTQTSPLPNGVKLPGNADSTTPETTEKPDSSSPLPTGTSIPDANAVDGVKATQDTAGSETADPAPKTGINGALSNPKIIQILQDNPQVLDILLKNPQILDYLIKNPSLIPK